MLRGVTSGHAAAQPPRFFEITNCRNFGFAQVASGKMLAVPGQPARDQANTGVGSQICADLADENEVVSEQSRDHSHFADLHPAVEEVTQTHYPRSSDRGPIEARVFLSVPVRVTIYPRSSDRGPIEARN